MIVSDKCMRLNFVTKRRRFVVRQPARSDCVVKPDVFNLAVLGEQFFQLRLFHFRIDGLVVSIRSAGPVPVPFRKVQRQLDSVLVAGLSQLRQDVFFQRGVGRLELGRLRVPQAEAVVVLRQKENVSHSGFFCRSRPLVGVDVCRLEEFRRFSRRVCPFRSGERTKRPANEHAPFEVF